MGWALLLGIADVASVAAACREAAERGLGWLVLAEPGGDDDVAMGQGAGPLAGEAGWKAGDPGLVVGEAGWRAGGPGSGASLQLDARLVERLPALLRVYVGAASAAHGDYRDADLIKIQNRMRRDAGGHRACELARAGRELDRAAGVGRAGARPGHRLVRHGPAGLRLLLAGAVAQDPRAHRPEARSARRL